MQQWKLSLGLALLFLGTGQPEAFISSTMGSHSETHAIAQVPVNTRTLYVNPTLGNDLPNFGTVAGAPLRTITYALQQSQPGTVIQLAPGSYTKDTGEVFPLVLRPGVVLRGDEAKKGQGVLIIGGGSYISASFARQNIAILGSSESEIRGVTVTNPNTRGTGLWVESSNPRIENNTFAQSLRDGVFITGTGNPIVASNIFTSNQGNGIAAARKAQGEIRDNLFQNTGFGIAVSDTAAPLISGNQVLENTDGIVISNRANPVLRGNTVKSNKRDGVVAISDAKPNLGTSVNPGNNVVQGNGRFDLYIATRSAAPLDMVGSEIGRIQTGVVRGNVPTRPITQPNKPTAAKPAARPSKPQTAKPKPAASVKPRSSTSR